jgi:hypothetical protein
MASDYTDGPSLAAGAKAVRAPSAGPSRAERAVRLGACRGRKLAPPPMTWHIRCPGLSGFLGPMASRAAGHDGAAIQEKPTPLSAPAIARWPARMPSPVSHKVYQRRRTALWKGKGHRRPGQVPAARLVAPPKCHTPVMRSSR